MDQIDAEYMRRRRDQERQQAERAGTDEARIIHRQLAAAYDKRVQQLEVNVRRSAFAIVGEAGAA